MNTAESNKLIAEFMGVKPRKTKHTEHWYNGRELEEAGLPFACGAMGNGTDEPKFHTSWDWLMPVVEKIESLNDGGFDVSINFGSTLIDRTRDSKDGNLHSPKRLFEITLSEGYDYPNKIGFTYQAVVEFIQWYNENK